MPQRTTMKPVLLLATLIGFAIHAPRAMADPPSAPVSASAQVTAPMVDPAAAPANLDACNIVFDSLSKDEADSIPLGNGNTGINLWVEANGDLLFYCEELERFEN